MRIADMELTCQMCGEKFVGYPNKKYCSYKCARKANNKSSEKTIVCENCKKKFRTRHHKTQNFCSLDCWNEFKTKNNTVEKTCKRCGKKFIVKKTRDKRYNVTFCSIECYGKKKQSSYEFNLINELKKIYNGEIIHGYKPKWLKGKEIDIFIPDKNIGIEVNGLYWHSENGGRVDKFYHQEKSDLCLKCGVKLIHIFTDELEENFEVIFKRLQSIICENNNVIHARKCIVKDISSLEAREFLNENHTQRYVNSSIRYGLFHEESLISVMTFGKLRKVLGSKSSDDEYELLRYASKEKIVGGFAKLFKQFINEHNPQRITSYMDMRWNPDINNNVYMKNGFSFVHVSDPNFWYTNNYLEREHRFGYRKSELIKQGFDPNKSEREIMIERGYDRIYNCGSAKFIYQIV